MTKDEIIEMAEKCGWNQGNTWDDCMCCGTFNLEAFVELIEAKKQADIESLHALYEQACKQRDEVMDWQRAMIANMRGQMQ
jgi:hypothetical protein